jgi:hypothetical protein
MGGRGKVFQNGAIALGLGHPKRESGCKCLIMYRNEPAWGKSIKFSFFGFQWQIGPLFLN